MDFRLTDHAEKERVRRSIPAEILQDVLRSPQQIIPQSRGRKAYQSQVDFGEGRIRLVRAIVEDAQSPAVVITVYRTSKIDKYWSAL